MRYLASRIWARQLMTVRVNIGVNGKYSGRRRLADVMEGGRRERKKGGRERRREGGRREKEIAKE